MKRTTRKNLTINERVLAVLESNAAIKGESSSAIVTRAIEREIMPTGPLSWFLDNIPEDANPYLAVYNICQAVADGELGISADGATQLLSSFLSIPDAPTMIPKSEMVDASEFDYAVNQMVNDWYPTGLGLKRIEYYLTDVSNSNEVYPMQLLAEMKNSYIRALSIRPAFWQILAILYLNLQSENALGYTALILKDLEHSITFASGVDISNIKLGEVTADAEKSTVYELEKDYGKAIVSSEYIVLNPYAAPFSRYGYVLAAQNGKSYNFPLFLYFAKNGESKDAVEKIMFQMISSVNDEWKKALETTVTPIWEDRQFVNRDEYQKSLQPGIFMLPIQGSKRHEFLYNGQYPYSSYIIRPRGYDFTIDDEIQA